MMIRTVFLLSFLFVAHLFNAQQNAEFQAAKKFFDFQRSMLSTEFKKQFDGEKNALSKQNMTKDFSSFMKKLDSVQNAAYIGTLIKVKNREDLQRFSITKENTAPNSAKQNITDANLKAEYPGGTDVLRSQVAELFYTDAILPTEKTVKTEVVFVVEKDGSISSVKAQGENFVFNRQAEIAMYLLPERFSPASINGVAVRYKLRLPLTMNFE